MSVTRLFFEIHVGKGLTVQIFHDKTGVQFLDGPGLRKVALRQNHPMHGKTPKPRRSPADEWFNFRPSLGAK
jgi:hypothetical protein